MGYWFRCLCRRYRGLPWFTAGAFRYGSPAIADAIGEARRRAPLQGHRRLFQENCSRRGSRLWIVQGFHGKCLAKRRWCSRARLLRQGQERSRTLIFAWAVDGINIVLLWLACKQKKR